MDNDVLIETLNIIFLQSVDFPTITICNFNPIRSAKLKESLAEFSTFADESKSKNPSFNYIMLCSRLFNGLNKPALQGRFSPN